MKKIILNAIRAWTIIRITLRYRLDLVAQDDDVFGRHAPAGLKLLRHLSFLPAPSLSRGERLKLALVALGPIFVKLGQTLSTRRDMLPVDIADELAQLQDRVPPFSSEQAVAILTQAYQQPPSKIFAYFDETPIASASIAQVHRATLRTGEYVAVKVLRPGILAQIEQDLALMLMAAQWLQNRSADGKRLRPLEVVQEFNTVLHGELDLMLEAANCDQLRHNFPPNTARGDLLYVPNVFWDYCRKTVLVTEWVDGIQINRLDDLQTAGVNLQKLASDGVEIFFTQVFTDGYFHADMHPGNILVDITPNGQYFGRYIALDFGIMGTLSDIDKHYLAHNFLAFFRRDYKAVAQLHVDSGWVPANTRVDELAMAIRACCEPFFNKPIKDISLGLVLMRLFDASRRFNVEIQPQLVLLQKTLLNTEGLGRSLNPDLDLWQTAQPILERWMKAQLGWPSFKQRLMREIPQWAELLPEIPRLLHGGLAALVHNKSTQSNNTSAYATESLHLLIQQLQCQYDVQRRWLWLSYVVLTLILAICLGLIYTLYIL
ncbi:MAG: ubiquinone biosynthesis regulatory protein kinase UbiB [Pseudomonadota bacterium]|jgi:ubiquinone biosynthesis protein